MTKSTTMATAIAIGISLALTGVAQAKTFEVTRKNDPAPGNCKPNDCSLREAVLAANERPGKDEIVLPEAERYKLTRANPGGVSEDVGESGDLDVNNDPLAIIHTGRGKAKIDNDVAGDRVLHIQEGANTAVKRVVVTGGDAVSDDAGGILTDASLRLVRSKVVNNAGDDGAGIDLDEEAKLTMKRSVVSKNEALDDGGGINTSGSGAVVTRSRISGNTAGGEGGGLDLVGDATARVIRSTVSGNSSADDAGGIDANAVSIVVKKSTIAGNLSGEDGGGLYSADAAEISVRDSTVSGNHADGGGSDGGGMYFDGPSVSIANSTISGNRATINGGGIQAQDGADLTLNAVTVVRNVADEDGLIPVGLGGGGIYRLSSAGFDVRNSIIALNLSNVTPNDCEGDTPIDSLGNNLLSTLSEGACEGFDGPNDLVRSNPKIGKLRKNGGPTKTVALKKGSAAIGHAHKPSAPNRDQRGRPRDNNPDSGAFER